MKASIVCGVSLFAGLATGLYFDQRDEDRYVTKEAVALGLGAGQTLEGEGTAKAAGAAEATVGADQLKAAAMMVQILVSNQVVAGTQPASGADLPVETSMNSRAGRGDLLLVPLHLADGGELLFIFDTGAPFTFFDNSLTPKLGHESGKGTISSIFGLASSHYYQEPDLYWGNVRLRNCGVLMTMDLGQVSRNLTQWTHARHQLMGILGMDCLWHYRIQLDFVAEKIRFLETSQLHAADLGRAFPLTLTPQTCPVVTGVKDWSCALDTGHIGTCPTNVLGLEFLARHLVTFDFPGRKMYLKAVSGSPSPGASPKPQPNPQGGANGSQPSRSETNRTSSAAGARRSP